MDDKVPKNIAETVAETVGVSKATSPWLSLFVLGVMAVAYIGFGGLFAIKSLVPVTIGNIIGGVVFVGLGYWGAYLRPTK